MLQTEKIRELLSAGTIKENEPMSKHTTFRIGGKADIYIETVYIEELIDVIKYLRSEDYPYFLMGNGSNLLVSDDVYRGAVVVTKAGNIPDTVSEKYHLLNDIRIYKDDNDMNNIQVREYIIENGYAKKNDISGKTVVYAGSGVLLSKLASKIAENELKGFEFAGGIPGTLGGAVTMNAGAYGGEIKDVIFGARVLTSSGEVKVLTAEELKLGYRTSIIQSEDMIVLDAVFAFDKGDKNEIIEKMNDFNKRRRDKQPLEYGSAGSTFKRPEGYFAGKLIQDAGLKGYRVGDVMVSDKHSGFVVNVGNGTCRQAMEVIEHVQNQVMEKFGVSLELEVKKLGDFERTY
ncbi:MAG: UDP-N-acetylmuramate dehydrogenase [Lachnospiraceae bacterium]|nr:UDP-N-acetylmuramate dehydrogenase [Lachnospiraceae bacterium]